MVNTLIGFSYVATTIASFGTGLFFVCILLRRTEVTAPENAPHFLGLLRLARNSSICFAVLAWLIASCHPWETCLREYGVLGKLCRNLGEDWFLLGILLLASALLLNLAAREASERAAMGKLPFSSLVTGMIFWIFSVLLTGL